MVVPLDPTQLNGDERVCTTAAPELVREIKNNPAAFYLNVHTAAYPGGAVRGQLVTELLEMSLSPSQEVPPSTSTSSGRLLVIAPGGDTSEICINLFTTIPAATGMHIHRGAVGVNGPVVVPFDPTRLHGEQCARVTPELRLEIAGNPQDFYFNIHTAAFPGGEIRGQLTIFDAPRLPTAPPSAPAPVVLPTGVNAGSGGQAAGGAVGSQWLVLGAAITGAAALLGLRATARRRSSDVPAA